MRGSLHLLLAALRLDAVNVLGPDRKRILLRLALDWLRVAVHLCPFRDTHPILLGRHSSSSPAALRFESSDLCLEFVHHDLQLQVFVPQAA